MSPSGAGFEELGVFARKVDLCACCDVVNISRQQRLHLKTLLAVIKSCPNLEHRLPQAIENCAGGSKPTQACQKGEFRQHGRWGDAGVFGGEGVAGDKSDCGVRLVIKSPSITHF